MPDGERVELEYACGTGSDIEERTTPDPLRT